MRLEPYRRVLALPGVSSLVLVALVARIPVTATGITLTLHVVQDLDRGYGAAGAVGAVVTVGTALGAPLLGRLVDRRGLRPMLILTTVGQALFWAAAPALGYPALLVLAAAGGLLSLPVFSVVRQSIAALVPERQRRQAYALDSMSVELSFMIGPALAVLMITQGSAGRVMIALGAALVASGIALYLLNPPIRTEDEEPAGGVVTRHRDWLGGPLLAVLAVSLVAGMVLAGTDVALVAELRSIGQVQWTGLVLAVWGAASLAGGFVFGSIRRPPSPFALAALLGALTVPVGVGHGWGALCLAILPAGALCAPSIAASSEAVSRLVPAGARGEAMGWHGSSLTVGMAVGAPFAGAVIDRFSAGWGFAAVGLVGACLAVALLPQARRLARDESGAPVTSAPVTGEAAASAPASSAYAVDNR